MEQETYEEWLTPEDVAVIFRLPPVLGRSIVKGWFNAGMPCVRRGRANRARMTKRAWVEEWLETHAKGEDVATEAAIVRGLFPSMWGELQTLVRMIRARELSIANLPPAEEEAQSFAESLLWSAMSTSFAVLEEETENKVKEGWKHMQQYAERKYRSD